jgi:hypothetical protein
MDDSIIAKLLSDAVYLAMMMIVHCLCVGAGIKARHHPRLYAPAG